MNTIKCSPDRRMMFKVFLMLLLAVAVVVIGGCGGDGSSADTSTTAGASSDQSSSDSGASANPSDEAGVAMAEQILAAFDEMNTKAAEMAGGKPEPAVLKPQLEELYDSYGPIMTELNGKYLALRDSDQFAFQACNRFISDNRPQRVFAMENNIVDAIKYYNFELGDQEIVGLLTKKPIELLDVAVRQN